MKHLLSYFLACEEAADKVIIDVSSKIDTGQLRAPGLQRLALYLNLLCSGDPDYHSSDYRYYLYHPDAHRYPHRYDIDNPPPILVNDGGYTT